MATKKVLWLVSTKAKGLKFRVRSLNKEALTAVLEGDTGVPFETNIDQPTLDKLGYAVEITHEEVDDDATVHSQPQAA